MLQYIQCLQRLQAKRKKTCMMRHMVIICFFEGFFRLFSRGGHFFNDKNVQLLPKNRTDISVGFTLAARHKITAKVSTSAIYISSLVDCDCLSANPLTANNDINMLDFLYELFKPFVIAFGFTHNDNKSKSTS